MAFLYFERMLHTNSHGGKMTKSATATKGSTVSSTSRADALTVLELGPDDPSTLRQRAILSLLRAINIGQVVGFVGSGATVIYGYPEWKELAN